MSKLCGPSLIAEGPRKPKYSINLFESLGLHSKNKFELHPPWPASLQLYSFYAIVFQSSYLGDCFASR